MKQSFYMTNHGGARHCRDKYQRINYQYKNKGAVLAKEKCQI